jgi:hypothetical protein
VVVSYFQSIYRSLVLIKQKKNARCLIALPLVTRKSNKFLGRLEAKLRGTRVTLPSDLSNNTKFDLHFKHTVFEVVESIPFITLLVVILTEAFMRALCVQELPLYQDRQCMVERIVEVLSCSHCCSGKALLHILSLCI